MAIKKAHAKQSVLEIVLTEGRNREIRRLLAHVGHKVQQLKRIAIGPVRLGELPVGAYREMTHQELIQLRRAVSGPATTKRRRSTTSRSGSRSTAPGGKRGLRRGKPSTDSRPRHGTVLGADRAERRESKRPAGGSAKRSTRRPVKRK